MAVNNSPSRAAAADEGHDRDFATATREVATEVADRASAVAARLPEAAATTKVAVEEAARRMEAGAWRWACSSAAPTDSWSRSP